MRIYDDEETTSSCFSVLKGVGQGCAMSPYFFGIFSELIMREVLEFFKDGMRIEAGELLYYFNRNFTAGTTVQGLVSRSCIGLLINIGKTKTVVTAGAECDVNIDDS